MLKWLPRKVLYLLVGALVEILRAKFPNLPLPTTDQVEWGVGLLIGGHTLTDVAAVLKGAARPKEAPKSP